MKKEIIIQLDTSLDHLTGEEIGQALTSLADDPYILDVIYLAGTGKKNRPAGLLQALCARGDEEGAVKAIFRHTHTLGVRRMEVERYVLERRPASMEIDGEKIKAKEYELEDNVYIRPESDEVARLARASGVGAPALRLKKQA